MEIECQNNHYGTLLMGYRMRIKRKEDISPFYPHMYLDESQAIPPPKGPLWGWCWGGPPGHGVGGGGRKRHITWNLYFLVWYLSGHRSNDACVGRDRHPHFIGDRHDRSQFTGLTALRKRPIA
jgi:hypothetical protein